MNESREESNRRRPVSEQNLERNGGVFDVISLQSDPGEETDDTDDERSENLFEKRALAQAHRLLSDGDLRERQSTGMCFHRKSVQS